MKLKDIIRNIKILRCTADLETEITGVCYDSRRVQPGELFVAVRGFSSDGHDFIPKATAQGAAAILTARDVEPPAGMSVLKVPELNKSLEVIVPYFHDYPAKAMRVIGITGTNGKTTTSYITRAILR